MMNAVTNAELAILGLVAEKPRHGYEIDQVIKERGMRDWTDVGLSTIYYLLKSLERNGLIEGRLEEPERGPARRVYQLTSGGRKAFQAAVLDALSVPGHFHSPLQLGLANLPSIPAADALDALRHHRDELVTRLNQLQEKRNSQQSIPYHVDAMFQHSSMMIRAEIRWLDQFTRELEEYHAQD